MTCGIENMSEVTINDEEIEASLTKILEECDLSTTTLKSLIKQLENELDVSLTKKKEFISKVLNEFIEKKTSEVAQDDSWSDSSDSKDDNEDSNEGEEDENNEDNTKIKKPRSNTGFNKPLQLSTELGIFMDATISTRSAVVQRMWEYIKQNSLQNPKDKREILCNTTLEKIFKRKKFTMFQMNKYLALLMKDVESLQEGTSKVKENPTYRRNYEREQAIKQSNNHAKMLLRKRKAEESKKTATITIKSKKTKDKDGTRTGTDEVKPNGFTKLMGLSPELAAFLGQEQESRTQIISKLWIYIKENNLQDPKDKREILLDDKLKTIFKVNRVNMFKMNSYLKRHIYEPEPS